jgi:hypothetical protein
MEAVFKSRYLQLVASAARARAAKAAKRANGHTTLNFSIIHSISFGSPSIHNTLLSAIPTILDNGGYRARGIKSPELMSMRGYIGFVRSALISEAVLYSVT